MYTVVTPKDLRRKYIRGTQQNCGHCEFGNKTVPLLILFNYISPNFCVVLYCGYLYPKFIRCKI